MILGLALLIGVVAGLRAMTAPAAVSWAAALGWLPLGNTPLAFMGSAVTPWLLTVLALGELVTDTFPGTPSRKIAIQFGARLIAGALSGACIGAAAGSLAGGLLAGALGAAIGTFGGAAFRDKLAGALRRDLPAALIEDAIAIGGALLIVASAA